MIPLNIPAHKNCTGCGECCGAILVTEQEMKEIQIYLATHPEVKQEASQREGKLLHCPFRDDDKHSCRIYPVRPLVCRLMGVCKGMNCKNGNSANINYDAIIPKQGLLIMLNFCKW